MAGGVRVALYRWFCLSGRSSIRCFTMLSEAAMNSKLQCIEPPAFTPPLGSFIHASTDAQNWSLTGSMRTTAKRELSAYTVRCSSMVPMVCVPTEIDFVVLGAGGRVGWVSDATCAPSSSEESGSEAFKELLPATWRKQPGLALSTRGGCTNELFVTRMLKTHQNPCVQRVCQLDPQVCSAKHFPPPRNGVRITLGRC